jgi:hypothetical protein
VKRGAILAAVAVLGAVLVVGVVLMRGNDGGAGDQERPGGPATKAGPPVDGSNRPPMLEEPIKTSTDTKFEYDTAGRLSDTLTTITLASGCVDPDGDTVAFAWSATVGTLTPDGATATWSQPVSGGKPENGDVTITCSDPGGLQDSHTIKFR